MTTSIKKHIRHAALPLSAAMAMLTLTGCDDFLDTLPLNDVVLENYWTQKADVKSVLNSCYESLESPESVTRMAVWGELRSDNIIQGRSVGQDISDLLKENLLPTNSMAKWDVMYQTINRCNTVCHYAPIVMDRDPNYSEGEMRGNVAEAAFMRDLCYFYLIRTFRDVPMSFEPSIDDQRDYQVAPTPMNDALDSLIKDLKGVEDYAVRRYVDDSRMTNSEAAADAAENSSRVTRVAVWALLADVSLWRGNYDDCIEYCDKVINFKKEQYRLKKDNLGDLTDVIELAGVPLLREKNDGATRSGSAYGQIFGTGNSFESLFELHFRTNQSVSNSFVNTYYGSSSQPLGYLSAPSMHCKDAALGNCDLYAKNDCRVYEYMAATNSRYAIKKYVFTSVSLDNSNVTDERSLRLSTSTRGNAYANWIVYRLTDVMLMKAEALVEKGGDDNYTSAFAMVNAVNKRARSLYDGTARDTLVMDDYKTSREKMEQLVLDERNRELMFEGKHWYDLVRMALRDGDNQRLITQATAKYEDNVNAIKIKLADPNILFFPYYRDELRLNPYLTQNSAYKDTEEFE